MGNIGTVHARYLLAGAVNDACLTAVCDNNAAKHAAIRQLVGDSVTLFSDARDMLESGLIDAVIVATPHYDHPGLSIMAMRLGIHTLCEKPAGVYTAQVKEMNACARECDVVFSMMYNQRPNPLYQKVKDLIDSGELGELRRSNWIITNWYRSQSYYNSGGWRATWKGEGGGVLLNQDPHQLDLWQWLVGMPVRMRAFCQFGKHRQIEVENEVTAYAEYANGATGSSSPPPPKHRAPTVWKLSAIAEKWLSKRDVCVSGGYVNLKQTLTPAGKMASVSRSAGKSSSLPPRSVANTLLLPVISPPLSCMANRSSPQVRRAFMV